MKFVTWGLTLIFVSCAPAVYQQSYVSNLASVTSYKIETPIKSKAGVHYGGTLDPIALDYAVGRVAACLKRIPEPTDVEKLAMECLHPQIRRDVNLELFDVYMAPNWGYTTCSKEQGFTCGIDPQACVDKGLTPTAKCPCRCRATVQGGRTIVTTPNMKLLPAELTRLVTGCNNPWAGPLSECAAPSPYLAPPTK